MKKSAGLTALGIAVSVCVSYGAEPGSLFLDAGLRSAVWKVKEGDPRLAMGGGMGMVYGANESAELELRLDYQFIPPRTGPAPAPAIEISDGELVAYFAPYHGDFRPMIGGHFGMVRVAKEDLRWCLGMDAMAVYDIQDRLQVYGTLTPGMLLGEGPGRIWMRMGAGVRARLGR